MSDTSQGPGWWLASDGKWYPPELWTGPPPDGPSPPAHRLRRPAAYPGQAARASRRRRAHPYQRPDPAPGLRGQYPAPTASTAYGVQVKRNNGLAVASLVCSCAGFVLFVPAGARRSSSGLLPARRSASPPGTQGGDGLALAGIIVGFAWIALFVILIAVDASNNNANGVVGLAPILTVVGMTA